MANRVGAFSTFSGVAPPWSLPNLDANFANVTAAFNDASLGYSNYSGTDTGSANNYVITLPFGSPSNYNQGMLVAFNPANTSTGASTLQVNPLAPVAIVRSDSTALSGGEVVAGAIIVMMFDGTSFRIISPSESAGVVKIFAGVSANIPPAHLLCNGAAVSRTTYAPLFAKCGTTYGAGDGSTTFNIPNMSGGRFAVGPGTVGATGGAASVALGAAQLPVHNHVININDPQHAHFLGDAVGIANGAFANCIKVAVGSSDVTSTQPTGITATSNNAGSGSAFSILPPFLTFNFAIKT